MMLNMLFQQFRVQGVRLVPGKAGIAFVEFGSDAQAGVAMAGLQGFKVTPTNDEDHACEVVASAAARAN